MMRRRKIKRRDAACQIINIPRRLRAHLLPGSVPYQSRGQVRAEGEKAAFPVMG